VFGMMVMLGVALTIFAWVMLPETHPPERRSKLHFGDLARTSWSIACNARFLWLALSAALCFGAVLTYIGAAPAIVMKTWGLSETQFYALFVPIIGGFMVSSFVGNRTAGRVRRSTQLSIGFALMFVASVVAVAVELVLPDPPRLMQQVPLFVLAFGAQSTFPILALEMLDLFPDARGAAASVQSFVALGLISLEMGFVSPLLEGSLLRLAVLALAGSIFAALFWRLGARSGRKK
jgi:MFS transporter, DHA1 family, multidrug resistance protein